MRYLSYRCATCEFRVRVKTLLKRWDIECTDEFGNALCEDPSCNESSFYGSPRCAKHISDYVRKQRAAKLAVDMKNLQKTFESMVRQQWHYSAECEIVRKRIADISTGKRPGSALVVPDDEFDGSKKPVEFAIIERVSGHVLINAAIEH